MIIIWFLYCLSSGGLFYGSVSLLFTDCSAHSWGHSSWCRRRYRLLLDPKPFQTGRSWGDYDLSLWWWWWLQWKTRFKNSYSKFKSNRFLIGLFFSFLISFVCLFVDLIENDRCGSMPWLKFSSPTAWELVRWSPWEVITNTIITSTGLSIDCIRFKSTWLLFDLWFIWMIQQTIVTGMRHQFGYEFLFRIRHFLGHRIHGQRTKQARQWSGCFRYTSCISFVKEIELELEKLSRHGFLIDWLIR